MELQEVIIEDINETYARGKYGEFGIILRKADSYVNATKLCARGGKQFKHWLENASSKRLVLAALEELRKDGGDRDIEILCTFVGGPNPELRGTYVHPLVVPHIACWVSAGFAIAVSSLINKGLVDRHRRRVRELEEINQGMSARVLSLEDALRKLSDRRDAFSRSLVPAENGKSEVGCLYFIVGDGCPGRFKIGYTYCISERLKTLQIGCPLSLRAHATILTLAPEKAEADAHLYFAAKHVHGEWYDLTMSEVDAYVAGLRNEDMSSVL